MYNLCRYGSGGHLLGPVGFDTVSVAGLNVKNQQVPLVNNTTFVSDGISSGLLGLAFPNLTRVYNTSTKPSTLEPYSPFFYNAVQQHKLKPGVCIYTLAVQPVNWLFQWVRVLRYFQPPFARESNQLVIRSPLGLHLLRRHSTCTNHSSRGNCQSRDRDCQSFIRTPVSVVDRDRRRLHLSKLDFRPNERHSARRHWISLHWCIRGYGQCI